MNHALENTIKQVVNLVMIGTPQLKLVHRSVQVLINILVPAQIKPEEVVKLVAENIRHVLAQVLTRGAMVVVLVHVFINILVPEQVIPVVAEPLAADYMRLALVLATIFGMENFALKKMLV